VRRAYLQLRYSMPDRVAKFRTGLQRLGFQVFDGPTWDPRQTDVLVTWNRIREGHDVAKRFEAVGARVIVAENATWGNGFTGGPWLTLVRNYHNLRGNFPIGGHERWDALGVDLCDWRKAGETVLLPQRGIGPPGVAMPFDWQMRYRGQGRVRIHPGTGPCAPLREDLAQAGLVRTWGSGAAVLACMWGIPVRSDLRGWIAEQDNTDAGRLRMLRELAWAQVRLEEIETGEAFDRILA
jgi:hypothetical protein